MSDDKVKNCNFSCVCNRKDCERKHFIDEIEKRAQFKELYEKLYDKKEHRETDPDGVRERNCFFGGLCRDKDCNYKHFCNAEGRAVIIKAWYRDCKKNDNAEFIADLSGRYKFSKEDLEELKKRLR